MDPLSIAASLIAVVTACLQTTNSLVATIKRYKGRDKTLRGLLVGLEDLINILRMLEKVKPVEETTKMIIQGPVTRCQQMCQEFEAAMESFVKKQKLSLLDWAKMEFMSSDISDFVETIAMYKSTISIGVGMITMQSLKLNQQVVEEYSEMVKDTSYDLQLRLQRIEDRQNIRVSDTSIDTSVTTDLNDELAVTRDCLRICEEATAYIESIQAKEKPTLGHEEEQMAAHVKDRFAAQIVIDRALQANREGLVETMKTLQARLNVVLNGSGKQREQARSRLLEEIAVTKQCLEVCSLATEQVHHVKIHTIGTVVAEDNTDQVVVTTLADLFNVDKVQAGSGSLQLVGSMNDQSLQQLSKDRYGNRVGTVDGKAEALDVHGPSSSPEPSRQIPQHLHASRSATDKKETTEKPFANQIKRRTTGNG